MEKEFEKIDNPYKILGLKENSSNIEIKKAYKNLILKYHPDKNITSSTEIFIKIKKSYDILKDEKQKKKYDNFLLSKSNKNNLVNNFILEKDIQRKKFAEELLKKEKDFKTNKEKLVKKNKTQNFYNFKKKNTYNNYEKKNIIKLNQKNEEKKIELRNHLKTIEFQIQKNSEFFFPKLSLKKFFNKFGLIKSFEYINYEKGIIEYKKIKYAERALKYLKKSIGLIKIKFKFDKDRNNIKYSINNPKSVNIELTTDNLNLLLSSNY